MPESIANLKRENNDLKSKVSTLTEEISRLKDLFQQQSSSAVSSAKEKSLRLEFLSKSFRKKIKELLLNFLRSEDDYVEVFRRIKLFNTLNGQFFSLLAKKISKFLVF